MNEHLMLGIPAIDDQHADLFDTFGKLAASGESDFPEEALSDILSRLGEHRAAHGVILEEFAQIHLDAMFGQGMSLPGIITTVAGWVHRHLVQYDLELRPYTTASQPR